METLIQISFILPTHLAVCTFTQLQEVDDWLMNRGLKLDPKLRAEILVSSCCFELRAYLPTKAYLAASNYSLFSVVVTVVSRS